MSDWGNDPQWQAYVTHVRTELMPKLEGSAIGISVVPVDPADVDVKFAVELGMMIMLDKPIVLVVDPTTLIPERLRRVADHIVVGNPADPETRDELMKAMKAVTDGLPE